MIQIDIQFILEKSCFSELKRTKFNPLRYENYPKYTFSSGDVFTPFYTYTFEIDAKTDIVNMVVKLLTFDYIVQQKKIFHINIASSFAHSVMERTDEGPKKKERKMY